MPRATQGAIGIIDVGSTTATLAVFRSRGHGFVERIEQWGEPLLLMRSVEDGRVSRDGAARLVDAIRGFKTRAARAGAVDIRAFATSAIRGADNQADLSASILAATGIRLSVLTGRREGEIAALAAVRTLPISRGTVVDVGGGSAQFVELSRGRPRTVASLPLGALRLHDAFLRRDPPSASELNALRRHLAQQLAPLTWLRGPVTGVGGSARALAKLARRRQNWPIGHSHGYFLRLEDIVELHEELSRMGLSDRAALPGLRQHRAETIAAGALAWEGIVRACGADGMRVSSHGLRGGLAIEALCPGAPDARGRRTAGILGRMPDPTGRGEPVRSRARAALDIGAKGADDTWLPALVLAAHAHCTGNADREHLVDNPVEGHLQEEVVLAARLLGLVPGKPPRPLADALATAVRS